jgi:hypothetical protein
MLSLYRLAKTIALRTYIIGYCYICWDILHSETVKKAITEQMH